MGFFNILEACRHHDISHLIYASSSAVYGGSKAHSARSSPPTPPSASTPPPKKPTKSWHIPYAHLYGLPCTGLRFFTVYGPWGRPDMAYWRFCARIMQQKPIPIYGEGKLSRDFTYIDDIIDGIMALIKLPPKKTANDLAPNRILNIGKQPPHPAQKFHHRPRRRYRHQSRKTFFGDASRRYAPHPSRHHRPTQPNRLQTKMAHHRRTQRIRKMVPPLARQHLRHA